jgi:hypothetical protein
VITDRTAVGRSLPIIITAMVLMLGCTPAADTSDPPVARAFGEQLYWSDLRQTVPVDASPDDSAALAQRFIQAWLMQQVVLNKAEQNLGAEKKDFEQQLQDYRRSLVIFAYEQALVDQKLDTTIARMEIEDYYEKNRPNFELQDNILRVRWFKVRESDKRAMRRLEEHFLSGQNERMREVELWLAERNVPIADRSASWTTLGELRSEIPEWDLQKPPVVLREGRMVLRSGDGGYFVDILELRPKDSVSPLPLVEQDIRSILINQRKLQLIERMREDLYREAQANNDVEVF